MRSELRKNRPENHTWTEVRLFSGFAQTFGASVSLALLLWMGIVRETLIAVSITFGLSVLSLLLWGGKSENLPFHWLRRNK